MMPKYSVAWILVAFTAAGCDSDDDPGTGGAGGSAITTTATSTGTGGQAPTMEMEARGSVEQVHVWRAAPNAKIELRDAADALVVEATSDALGSVVFREVTPGEGYAVVAPEVPDRPRVAPITVMTVEGSQPETSFYTSQTLVPGYNYITTRDGTTLAAYVTLPGPIENGPYPTVVNYSGYNPAEPGKPLGDFGTLCDDLPVLCDAPSDASAMIAALNGYATVGVNMRGTGCSGGAYDYFETLQLLDGYDVIETIAAQSWVRHNHVGMTGLSYPGITQLFVAKMHPPSLAAISPLSVIGNTYSTGRPGGIFNDGFALEWITNVLDKAAPYGQGWEQARVDGGDDICEENQLLHGQKVDVIQKAKDTPYYDDAVALPLDPSDFADEIEVPVFLTGAWQDEQTGPYFFELFDKFTNAPITRFTGYNGVHPDGFAPQILVEWKAFLDVYVAEAVPKISDQVRTLAPLLFAEFFGAQLQIPPDRFATFATWEEAKAAYEADDPYRVIFESGGSEDLGAPEGTHELWFSAWPPAETTPTRWYFQPDGSLGTAAPAVDSPSSQFHLNPAAGQGGILAPGGDVWDLLPEYDWKQPASGDAVVYDSAPLPADLVMVGSGSVDLWIRPTVDDADLEVNLSEIRPDGQEMFVQSGWLRASFRGVTPLATELWPVHGYREENEALLVPNEWVEARVGINAFSHVFRAGSRIRIMVDTPGDSRASWRFDLKEHAGGATYDVGQGVTHPSSVVLPVLGGMTAPTPLPACPSLRGQQCRTYVPFGNTNVP